MATPLGHGRSRSLGQPTWCDITDTVAHIACGLDALAPQPQLPVHAVRIFFAMRCFQAHRPFPALAGLQALHRPIAIPSHSNHRGPRRPVLGKCLRLCRIHLKTHTHAALNRLRHLGNHPTHPDITPFPSGRQCASLKHHRTPTRATPCQGCAHQQPSPPAAPCGPHTQQHQPHACCYHRPHIHRHRRQRTLLQLQGCARHHPAHGICTRRGVRSENHGMSWHTAKHAG